MASPPIDAGQATPDLTALGPDMKVLLQPAQPRASEGSATSVATSGAGGQAAGTTTEEEGGEVGGRKSKKRPSKRKGAQTPAPETTGGAEAAKPKRVRRKTKAAEASEAESRASSVPPSESTVDVGAPAESGEEAAEGAGVGAGRESVASSATTSSVAPDYSEQSAKDRRAQRREQIATPVELEWYPGCEKETELLKDDLPLDAIVSVFTILQHQEKELPGVPAPSGLTTLRYFSAKYTRAVNTALHNQLNTLKLKALYRHKFRLADAARHLPTLIGMANHPFLSQLDDEQQMLLAVEDELVKALGQEALAKLLVYRISILVDPAVWHRDKTPGVLRDLHPTEKESAKFIRQNLADCGTTETRLREQLNTAMQRGAMYNPLALFERLGRTLPGFAQVASRVLCAIGHRHHVMWVRSMSGALSATEVFSDFHWRETGSLALVTDFALCAESIRDLQALTTNLISPSVSWQALATAAFYDLRRIEPLALQNAARRVPKPILPEQEKAMSDAEKEAAKEAELNDEFFRLHLGIQPLDERCLVWQNPEALEAVLLKPCTSTNAMQDPVQQAITKYKNANLPVPLVAYIFRSATKRGTEKDCEALRKKARELMRQPKKADTEEAPAEKETDWAHLQRIESPAEAPFYTMPLEEAAIANNRIYPGVPSEMPIAALSVGMRMAREQILRNGIDPNKVIVLASTKCCAQAVPPHTMHDRVGTSVLVAVTCRGQVLICAVLGTESPTQYRCLWPNERADVVTNYGSSREDVRTAMCEVLGDDNLAVGWKVGSVLAGLGIVLPASQVLDLAHDPYVRMLAGIACDVNRPLEQDLQLPEVVYWLTSRRQNIRNRGDHSYRDPIEDAQSSRAIYQALVEYIDKERCLNMHTLAASGGIYVGAGRLLEMTAFENDEDARKASMLPRPPFAFPMSAGSPKMSDKEEGDRWSKLPTSPAQLLERRRLVTESPLANGDQLQIWDWEYQIEVVHRSRALKKAVDKMVEDGLDDLPIPECALNSVPLSTYNWMALLCSATAADVERGVVIAEDLPLADGAELETLVKGPITHETMIAYRIDPKRQPQSDAVGHHEGEGDDVDINYTNALRDFELFEATFMGHFRPAADTTPTKVESDSQASAPARTGSSASNTTPTPTPVPETEKETSPEAAGATVTERQIGMAVDQPISGAPAAVSTSTTTTSVAPAERPKTPPTAATATPSPPVLPPRHRKPQPSPVVSESPRAQRPTRAHPEVAPAVTTMDVPTPSVSTMSSISTPSTSAAASATSAIAAASTSNSPETDVTMIEKGAPGTTPTARPATSSSTAGAGGPSASKRKHRRHRPHAPTTTGAAGTATTTTTSTSTARQQPAATAATSTGTASGKGAAKGNTVTVTVHRKPGPVIAVSKVLQTAAAAVVLPLEAPAVRETRAAAASGPSGTSKSKKGSPGATTSGGKKSAEGQKRL